MHQEARSEHPRWQRVGAPAKQSITAPSGRAARRQAHPEPPAERKHRPMRDQPRSATEDPFSSQTSCVQGCSVQCR
eukprot:15459063-Alexandrium_andersonii.AAC.1